MNEAIVFDFDGTLADTIESARLIFNDLARQYGFKEVAVDHVPELRHLTLRGLLITLGVKQRHVPVLLSKGRKMLRERIEDLRPCAGILENLPTLRKQAVRFGILTSNSVENVEIFLNRHGVRAYFDFISTCSKLQGKAKHLRSIARTYSIKCDQMIYVGDEVRDMKAARKATVPVVGVTWGFNSSEALQKMEPNALVDQAQELVDFLTSHPTTHNPASPPNSLASI